MSENTNKQISVEEKYQEMSDIDHVLKRPAVYVGDIHGKKVDYNLYKPSENKIVLVNDVVFNAALLKLFDEVISNSVDERRRLSRLFDVNHIKVNINQDGTISVSDDGGIAVEYHSVAKCYVPEMIFGRMKTSSNYSDDSVARTGAGLNGLGAKLTNIYSLWFRCETSDSKNKFDVKWQNNMKEIVHANTTKETNPKNHGTTITFKIDLERFEITKLDLSTIRIMQKRCIDSCAANPGLKISFTSDVADGALNSDWEFDNFSEYVKLHLNPDQQHTVKEWTSISKRDHIAIVPSIGYNYGFVNGAICSFGTHIKTVKDQIVTQIMIFLKKKDMELITKKDVESFFNVFVTTTVHNPDYESQAKLELTSKIPKDILNIDITFLRSLEDSDIVKQLVDFYELKYAAEQKKNIGKLNGVLKATKSKKLIACSNKLDRMNNEIFLFEGTSASNGFREHGNPSNQACYLLRGKVKNTLNLTPNQIVENVELREIVAALGLQFKKPKENLKSCNYGKIIFGSDMDLDGAHICGLLITFFAKHFPELFIDGRIYRLISPIIIAEKNKVEKFYYTQEEFEADKINLKGWEIGYKKGLGSLEDRHYQKMLQEQKLMQFSIGKDYLEVIEVWFDKATEQRKEILIAESAEGLVEEFATI